MATSESPDNLSDTALEWALKNVRRFGDTDIFPVPFEYSCIAADWPAVKAALAAVDLSKWPTRSLFRVLVPKPQGGFRVATQLDPLDTLIYSAAIHEAAEPIEASRVSADRACSYRLAPTADGTLFKNQQDGWSEFHANSRAALSDSTYRYIVTADLADFYSQASHHRIQNALEYAGVSEMRAHNIEALLSGFNAKHHSRGIPVGPYPSIAVAEACLNDVDLFLLRKNLRHVRYVDDFRIFCKSRAESVRALHDLTEYLYTAHRLALQAAKTRLWRRDTFLKNELHDPEEQESWTKEQRILALLEDIEYTTGYPALADELQAETLRQVDVDTLAELFGQMVKRIPIHLGTARYLLRRATALKTRVIADVVVENLGVLVPVFRDVALYLSRTLNDESARNCADRLFTFFETSEYGMLPFVRLWAFHLIQRRPAMVSSTRAVALADAAYRDLGMRPMALTARAYRLMDWARGEKERWSAYGPWDRRAVIWASAILPADERRHWLNAVRTSGDILDNAVAKLAAHGLEPNT